MSFSDRPARTGWYILAVLAYALIAVAVVGNFGIDALHGGPCYYTPDAPGCGWERFKRWSLFLGSIVVALGLGVWLVRQSLRDEGGKND